MGLVDIPDAIALWDLDGVIPVGIQLQNICNSIDLFTSQGNISKGQNDKNGLTLYKGEAIKIGRIVNDEWFQGFKDENTCGYFPRLFVRIQRYVGASETKIVH